MASRRSSWLASGARTIVLISGLTLLSSSVSATSSSIDVDGSVITTSKARQRSRRTAVDVAGRAFQLVVARIEHAGQDRDQAGSGRMANTLCRDIVSTLLRTPGVRCAPRQQENSRMRHLRWDEAGAKGKGRRQKENTLVTADRQAAHQMSSPRIEEPPVLATFTGAPPGTSVAASCAAPERPHETKVCDATFKDARDRRRCGGVGSHGM